MKRILAICVLFGLITGVLSAGEVYVLTIDGAIGPMTYHRVKNIVATAEKTPGAVVVLAMDTPGGLLSSTRKIVQTILQADVPIVAFVSPRGGQCASAGTFIALACHVVAMAPGTNIGAAHPVTLTGGENKTMQEKVVNDTVSFIRSVATLRNRNAAWAEDAVRKSVSITEQEAVKIGVSDLVADDLNDLLKKISGKNVSLPKGTRILRTEGAPVNTARATFGEQILSVIADPNVAYILLMIGMLGIVIELSHPGLGVPGIVGTICLILSFFALQTVSINMTGFLLLVVGFICFAIEAITPGFGLFLISGIISILLGSFMIFRTEPGAVFHTGVKVIVPLIVCAIVTTILLFVRQTRIRSVKTGGEGMIGQQGKAVTNLAPEGQVFVHGEYWKARTITGSTITKGTPVVVRRLDNLTVEVEPIPLEK